jgi:hypothetical protein
MNDVERELRELLNEKAREATGAPTAPREVLRRGRRRQVGTVLVAGLLALAAVAGSVAALRPLLRDDSVVVGDAPTTTRTINGVTISYPEGWFAADPREIGVEPANTPSSFPSMILTLTRDDPRIEGVLGCPGRAEAPAGQLLMTIREEPLALSGEAATPWPVPPQPLGIPAEATGDGSCYPGWTLLRASWTAVGRSFEARIGTAPEVSGADRAALLDAFESMRFSPPEPGAPEVIEIGSGTAFDGIAWSLTVSREEGSACFNLETPNTGFGSCTATLGVHDRPSVGIYDAGRDGAFAVGTVPWDVDAVVLETNGGDIIGDIGLFDPPEGFGGARYVVIPLPGEDRGLIRLHGAGRDDLYPPEPIDWRKDALSVGGAGSASGGGAASSAPSPLEGA